jgi:hypothetical protein
MRIQHNKRFPPTREWRNSQNKKTLQEFETLEGLYFTCKQSNIEKSNIELSQIN